MDSKDNNFQQEKGNENYQVVANMSSDWHFGGGGSNFANPSMGSNPAAVNPLESSSCSSAPMMDSFCPTVWDRPTNNLGFCDMNNASTSNTLVGVRKGPLGGIQTALDMGWIPPNSLVKGGMLLPPVSGMLPQSLSQFPADSGFIERAARFSCFGGGGFSGGMSPFGIPASMSPYLNKGGAVMMQQQQAQEVYGLKYAATGGQSQNNEMNIAEASKGVSCSADLGANNEGSPLKNDRKSESVLQSPNEAKSGAGVDESDEAEFSGGGGGGREEPSSSKALALKKRKRNGQDDEADNDKETSQTPGETAKNKSEMQQKNDQNPSSATNKANEKQNKQGSASGSPKEDYIHIRARRGQATNSHSLAERIRREKISERMKFLQDLVPGCSKVTGKAVMLDEIINYVQSLQRQVEFLSMKLATVNPQLDFNIDGLLAKEILQSRAGPSSKLGFPHDMAMPFPSLHPSQPGMIQTGLPGMSTTDALRRSINSQMMAISGGYKEATSQVPNMWGEDELHNVIQMGFNAPPESQDINGSLLQGQPKPEP